MRRTGVFCLFLVTVFAVTSLDAGYLKKRDIERIKANMPDYQYAADLVGVPVLLLPAIHYREAHLYKGWYSKNQKKVVKNIGGPFMLDPGPPDDNAEFSRRIREYEKTVFEYYGGKSIWVPRVSHDFRFSVVVAAHHLKAKARCSMDNSDCIADAVWGYNGRSGFHIDEEGNRTHRKSAYVWSDPKKGKTFLIRYRRRGGEFNVFVDERPGVMIIYNELLKLNLEVK